MDTDLTLWQALRGQTNLHHLTLKGTSVTLHFAADGRLLTQLPLDEGSTGAMPEVRLVDGRAVLRQDGRPPMTLAGIDANVHTEADALVLAGRIDDSDWGDWTIKGDWNVKTKKGSAALQSSRTHLTQTRVEEVPLVPASIWREVNALEGDTRAALDVNTAGPDNHVEYRLALEPIRTHIAVPSIELSGELTGGTIIVKDSLVGLRGVVAHTADGALDISGALDFRDAKRTRLQFDIVAKQLALTKLPSSWDLPREITGNLDGKAHLQLIIENGQVHTSGEGSGVVANAHVAGFPGRVELKITPAGKGFHFGKLPAVTLQRGEALPDARAVLAANADLEPLDWLSQVPARMVNELAQGIHLLSRSIVKTGQTMRGLVVKREPAPAPAQPAYLDVQLGLDNVDLGALIQRLKVKLPFAVDGKLTFELKVGIPTDTPRELKAYRLNGSASLAWLTLEGFRLDKVHARVAYANGILRLEELTGLLPHTPLGALSPEGGGEIKGTAKMELYPAKDLTADVTLKRLPLDRVASLVPDAAQHVGGLLTGTLSVQVPVAKLRDVETWNATSNIHAERLEVYGATLEALSVEASLRGQAPHQRRARQARRRPRVRLGHDDTDRGVSFSG